MSHVAPAQSLRRDPNASGQSRGPWSAGRRVPAPPVAASVAPPGSPRRTPRATPCLRNGGKRGGSIPLHLPRPAWPSAGPLPLPEERSLLSRSSPGLGDRVRLSRPSALIRYRERDPPCASNLKLFALRVQVV